MKNCSHCGNEFKPKIKRQIYCSDKCRQEFFNKRKRNDYYKQHYSENRNTKEWYISEMTNNCRVRTKDTDVDKEFITKLLIGCNERCTVSNIPFDYTNRFETFHNPLAPSLDQIVPSAGYYKDNIQLVCLFINRAKSDIPVTDFCKLMNKIQYPIGNNLIYILEDTYNYGN